MAPPARAMITMPLNRRQRRKPTNDLEHADSPVCACMKPSRRRLSKVHVLNSSFWLKMFYESQSIGRERTSKVS